MTERGPEAWRQPYHWWGLPWTAARPRTIPELVEQDTLTPPEAAWLVDHVRRGGSIAVAAGAAGAGKSTLAWALGETIEPGRVQIFIRGPHDPWDWLNSAPPASTTLLVNEISPHLPVYCWGDCARSVLALAASGYQLIATLHAQTPEELIALLQRAPIHASAEEVVALDVVVFLDIVPIRRITSIVQLALDGCPGRVIATPVTI